MQLGTLGGPIVVAIAIAIFKRDLVLSAAVVITGIVTWFAAKGVKRLVERDRPLTYLPEIIVREGDGSGLGYISGHSAVAASAAIMAMVAIPRRWRPAAAAVAAVVGVARIVHGVHLPADVVGGWSCRRPVRARRARAGRHGPSTARTLLTAGFGRPSYLNRVDAERTTSGSGARTTDSSLGSYGSSCSTWRIASRRAHFLTLELTTVQGACGVSVVRNMAHHGLDTRAVVPRLIEEHDSPPDGRCVT